MRLAHGEPITWPNSISVKQPSVEILPGFAICDIFLVFAGFFILLEGRREMGNTHTLLWREFHLIIFPVNPERDLARLKYGVQR
jgi:hypothetical protein